MSTIPSGFLPDGTPLPPFPEPEIEEESEPVEVQEPERQPEFRESLEAQLAPEARRAECPTCHRFVRRFLIENNKCDQCRIEDVRKLSNGPKLTWAEARQRRNVLLRESDATQLEDRSLTVRAAFKTWRQSLRDLTQAVGTPTAAWAELDRLESIRPSE